MSNQISFIAERSRQQWAASQHRMRSHWPRRKWTARTGWPERMWKSGARLCKQRNCGATDACEPFGASKSTFSEKRFKPLGLPCIDPDAVAKELFGRFVQNRDEAVQATVEASLRARKHLLEGRSIALESVFSDSKGYKLGLLEEARRAGFKTVLVFIGVDSPEICIARVQDRANLGGHDVPDNVIRDRFPRCFANLRKALARIDMALLIDNSGCYGPDIQVDGSRQYMFGLVDASLHAEIMEPVPNWFTRFGIADVI